MRRLLRVGPRMVFFQAEDTPHHAYRCLEGRLGVLEHPRARAEPTADAHNITYKLHTFLPLTPREIARGPKKVASPGRTSSCAVMRKRRLSRRESECTRLRTRRARACQCSRGPVAPRGVNGSPLRPLTPAQGARRGDSASTEERNPIARWVGTRRLHKW